ncbi:MAG: YbgC/FadM family acyl-CoA thioesterase [Roseiflexus sp.]|nr:YbgC/FadM family acyl-CoA thioesterase [Roseiflexus sp.]MBO9333833.1 YbgC/FadM family acyl-CoA thioesterase [Roseiflexus sp.]MBO9363838.1 YbgC/FadM family acyl-CoA thioesterase [Roseiflexus sp.]MBO9381049.1 YbgC/FadM family acyl-CoA thioesterase [Roseiflexus sp.]MBO9387408.1 YbgC/FadM family acyl-CoA thioesterase [Roseiflexus sp.]
MICKVYYEDTDALGVVYHANYLKYMERARSEYVELFGKPIWEWNRLGYYIVVYAMNIRFKRAAQLGDTLEVVSTFSLQSPYRGLFKQRVERDGQVYVEADVELTCLDPQRNLREFPPEFRSGRA